MPSLFELPSDSGVDGDGDGDGDEDMIKKKG